MPSKIPSALLEAQKALSESNDRVIADALAWLELSLDKPPTLDSLVEHTRISKGAIRSRPWVKERLKRIKADRKIGRVTIEHVPELFSEPTVKSLQAFLDAALIEKAVLFQEIIGLNDEISNLNRRQLIPPDSVVIKKKELEVLRKRQLIKSV